MREIKFRAWEKNLKEIIPVHNIDFEKKMINTESAWRLFDEIELIQYTGLKDKNGMEIYESDSIEDNIGIGSVEFSNGAYRVNYLNGNYKWLIDFLDSEKNQIEVVGNKYRQNKI